MTAIACFKKCSPGVSVWSNCRENGHALVLRLPRVVLVSCRAPSCVLKKGVAYFRKPTPTLRGDAFRAPCVSHQDTTFSQFDIGCKQLGIFTQYSHFMRANQHSPFFVNTFSMLVFFRTFFRSTTPVVVNSFAMLSFSYMFRKYHPHTYQFYLHVGAF